MATASQQWISLPYKARANDEKSSIFQRDLVIDEISPLPEGPLGRQGNLAKRLKCMRDLENSPGWHALRSMQGERPAGSVSAPGWRMTGLPLH
jgi:hypothetical protein